MQFKPFLGIICLLLLLFLNGTLSFIKKVVGYRCNYKRIFLQKTSSSLLQKHLFFIKSKDKF
jgi:hypothetical protein